MTLATSLSPLRSSVSTTMVVKPVCNGRATATTEPTGWVGEYAGSDAPYGPSGHPLDSRLGQASLSRARMAWDSIPPEITEASKPFCTRQRVAV